MIHELKVKNENDGKVKYYGVKINPPVDNIKDALEKATGNKLEIGSNYVVGIWANGRGDTSGQYFAFETSKRIWRIIPKAYTLTR